MNFIFLATVIVIGAVGGADVQTTTFPSFVDDVQVLTQNVVYSFASLLNEYILEMTGYNLQYFNSFSNITSESLIFGNSEVLRISRALESFLAMFFNNLSGRSGTLTTILSETLLLANDAVQNITANVNKIQAIVDNNVHLPETLQKIQNFLRVLY